MRSKSTIVRLFRVAAGLTSRVAPGLAARWLERLFLTPRPLALTATQAAWLQAAKQQRGQSLGRDAWRRLRQDRVAMLSLVFLGWMLALAFLAPLLCSAARVIF